MSKELKSYLSKKFEGRESFLENIVFPIFGEERFEDMYDVDALDNEDLQAMARRTGIKSAIQYGLVQVGTTEINIYDVTVSDRVMMRRNRVGIQQLIRRIMLDYTSAFIIFHYEDSDSWDWRFSFCQKDNKEVTEAKRYTFLLGPGQSCRTAADNFQKLIDKRGEINREDIVKAFDVEALSKEFFDKYKAQYEKFCNYIYDNCDDESLFGKEFAEWDEKLIRDYVKKLLGRIVFLHFLQKKGWLGVPFGKEWGEGDTQFMKHLFEASTQEQKENYLDCVLEPLFAGALNTQRPNDIFDLNVDGYRTTRIPYLNGGLFERDALDEPKSTFPASYFEELFDFFYQYNFTIDENDPNDAEVGIDPEMLGRIFENLLEDNKDKGAFYTPKEIVQYMCRESLIAYLTTCVMKKQGENHKPEDEIKASVRKLLNKPEEIVPRMTKEHLKDFDSYIRNVKICDPAIGSGAFPMGLLNELVRCRVFINAWAKDEKGNLLEGDYAALKTEIISNNIYGVDIEKGAIDIARLRFWLSIIVDEQNPHVLPNFDYKFMQGNSLIPTFDGKFINLETEKINKEYYKKLVAEKKELYRLKQLHYNASGNEKHELDVKIKYSILRLIAVRLGYESRSWYKNHVTQNSLFKDEETSFDIVRKTLPKEKQKVIEFVEALSNKLNDTSVPIEKRSQINIHFFDWRIMFTEVFDNGNDGFDIVIGNPPYISAPAQIANPILAKQREDIIASEKFVSLYQKWDLYIPFIEHGIQLACKDGVITMIVPYPLTNQIYGKKLREHIIANHELLELCDLNGTKIFENATVSNCIPFIRKSLSKHGVTAISHIDETKSIKIAYLKTVDDLVPDKKTAVWNVDNAKREANRHQDMNVLGDYCYISKGMVINADEKTAKGEFKKEDLISLTYDDVHCRKYIEAKDIEKYVVKRVRYLEYNTDRCPEQLSRPTFRELYEHPKLMVNRLGLLKVYFDEDSLLTSDSMFCAVPWFSLSRVNNKSITSSIKKFSRKTRMEMESLSKKVDLKYLLGVMNSKYADVLLTNLRGGDYHIYPEHIRNIPIPIATIEQQQSVVRIVDEIINAKKKNSDTSVLEYELDQLVYQLYCLTDEEIAIVEGRNEK